MPHRTHLTHYLVLALILLSGLGLFLVFRWQPHRQLLTVVVTVVGYVTWGVIHHKLEDRLSAGVILEYLLVGGVVICLFSLNLLG